MVNLPRVKLIGLGADRTFLRCSVAKLVLVKVFEVQRRTDSQRRSHLNNWHHVVFASPVFQHPTLLER